MQPPLPLKISLCYDGGLSNHLEVVVPALDRLGLPGTFFLDPAEAVQRLHGWKQAQKSGHELANGALLLSAQAEGHFPNWTAAMVQAELDETDDFLRTELEVPEPISAAYPIGEPKCADGLYLISREQVRSPNQGPNPLPVNPQAVHCIHTENWQLADFLFTLTNPDWAHQWIVFVIEGVGEGPGIDRQTHLELLEYLHAYPCLDVRTFGYHAKNQAEKEPF